VETKGKERRRTKNRSQGAAHKKSRKHDIREEEIRRKGRAR